MNKPPQKPSAHPIEHPLKYRWPERDTYPILPHDLPRITYHRLLLHFTCHLACRPYPAAPRLQGRVVATTIPDWLLRPCKSLTPPQATRSRSRLLSDTDTCLCAMIGQVWTTGLLPIYGDYASGPHRYRTLALYTYTPRHISCILRTQPE